MQPPSYLNKQFSGITDESFQRMIDEIYHCAGWKRDDTRFPWLHSLLSAIVSQNPRCLHEDFLPVEESLLLTKIGDLKWGTTLHDLCREIAFSKRVQIESLDKKTLLQLLSRVVKKRVRRPEPLMQGWHQDSTAIILQRRRNGDL